MRKESVFLDNVGERSAEFAPNKELDCILNTLFQLLSGAETESRKAFSSPKKPPLLIVGNPRSGTTLTLQFLASLGDFCYPSNLLARFSRVPHIGALIDRLLLDPDLDSHRETSDLAGNWSFSSNMGKTRGVRSPNEFNFFWRHFIPNFDPQFLEPDAVKEIDCTGIRSGIAAIEGVFDKPFAGKCLILQYNIPDLLKILPNALILNVRRKPFFVCQSILLARRQYYGDDRIWWSVKPREYETLKDLDPLRQIAGQVYYTERAIAIGLDEIPLENSLTIDYESLCEDPRRVYTQISDKYAKLGYEIEGTYSGPKAFENANRLGVAHEEAQRIQNAYRHFSADTSGDENY